MCGEKILYPRSQIKKKLPFLKAALLNESMFYFLNVLM